MSSPPKHEQPSNETAEVAAFYVLGCLDEQERREFEEHLQSGCPICHAETELANSVLTAFARSGVPEEPPNRLRNKFVQRLRAESVESFTKPASALAPLQPGTFVVRTDELDWQATTVTGIHTKVMFVESAGRCATILVRMAPGTSYPASLDLVAEEVFFLEGDLVVEGKRMRSGDYCLARSGIQGQSRSENGCLFFVKTSPLTADL